MNNSNFPILILAAKPQEKISSPLNFFDSTGPYFQLLKNTPHLRYLGWNLRTMDTPNIRDGNSWKVQNGDRKRIILYENLTLLTAASLSPDFLGWGTNEEDDHVRINSLALTEYVYEFSRLFHEIIKNTDQEIKSVKLNITIMDVGEKEKSIEIGASLVGSGHFNLPGRFITKDFTNSLEIEFATYDPRKVAFLILNKIFLQAGFPSDIQIPYTKNGEIDIEEILANK